MPDSSICEFCDEIAGGNHNSFSARYGKYIPNRTVFETDELKVVPSLGHFVKGYLLLIPKTHYCTLADIPYDALREIEDIMHSVVQRLQPIYGAYIFFEHGARGDGAGGCGIYHAHLHAVPLLARDVLASLRSQFRHTRITSLSDLKGMSRDSSYLYYQESSGQPWVFYPPVLPSQYMRRLLANVAGISDWDWRSSGWEDALLATKSEVCRALSESPWHQTLRIS